MKTRWEFRFETWDVVVGRPIRLAGRIQGRDRGAPVASTVPVEVTVLPDLETPHPGADSAGRMEITLSGRPEDTKEHAHIVALQMKEKMCFPHGRMRFRGGVLLAERLPETPEERNEIGDHPHWVELAVEEVPDLPSIDPERLTRVHLDRFVGPLLQQFNEAKGLIGPVERFLAFFKIVEAAFAKGRGRKLLQALKQSDELFEIGQGILQDLGAEKTRLDRIAFGRFLQNLVRVRDNCAHLRGNTGYRSDDPRLYSEVLPLVPFLVRCGEQFLSRRFQASEEELKARRKVPA